MLKKILFCGLVGIFLFNFNILLADDSTIIPLKKPNLTSEEIKKKISKNILKPLKKPNKIKIEKIKEKKVVEVKKEKKLSFKIPKKKTIYIWFNYTKKC